MPQPNWTDRYPRIAAMQQQPGDDILEQYDPDHHRAEDERHRRQRLPWRPLEDEDLEDDLS